MSAEAAVDTDGPRFSLWQRPVISWAFYDFANTIFSFAVITRYFNEWVIEDRAAPDWYVGAMGFVVGFFLLLTMVPLGAIADRYGRRKPFLIGFTLLSVVMTALIATTDTVLASLVVAGLAIYGFQSALAHYDPLLATVAPEPVRGRVSGFGVGLGYLGALAGAGTLLLVVGEGDKQAAFVPTAAMYLLFALPCFLFVHERRLERVSDGHSAAQVARAAFMQLAVTARNIGRYRAVVQFLVARFLYVDALAVTIAYMTVYMSRVGDFTENQKTVVLGLAMVCAAVGAFLSGTLVDRKGPRWVLVRILGLFVGTLVLAAATGAAWAVWVLGPLVGVCLGGVWTSDRVFMMRLSPPRFRGEFFGMYNLIGKLSSGVGPLVLWGGTVWLFHEQFGSSLLDASRIALIALAVATVLGLVLIGPLSDARLEWPDEDLEREIAPGAGAAR